jgi:iron complex transport system substrate-binding protein
MFARHSISTAVARKRFAESCRPVRNFGYGLVLSLLLSTSLWAAHWERDDAGHSVAVPEHVHRIVSLSPSLTDIVYALGAQNDLVGITDYTDYPPQAAREKPSVGAIVNPSLEKILGLHPDIVLALPAFNGADTIAGLQHLGLAVFLFNTSVESDIYRNVASVGRILGREQQASALIVQLQAREQRVKQQSMGKTRLKVLVVVAIEPLITAGRSAFMTEMITAAGAESVTRDIPQDWLQMNLEAVLPRNPDYILLIQGGPVTLKDMRQHPGWSSLEAVRTGRIITVDSRIQIPSPVAFDGLEDLARQIHAVQSH